MKPASPAPEFAQPKPQHGSAAIEFSDVHFGCHGGQQVLAGVTFRILSLQNLPAPTARKRLKSYDLVG